MSASMEDERIAERRVLLVLDGAPLRMRREELAEGARFALAGMPAVVKPVVEKQDRAILRIDRNQSARARPWNGPPEMLPAAFRQKIRRAASAEEIRTLRTNGASHRASPDRRCSAADATSDSTSSRRAATARAPRWNPAGPETNRTRRPDVPFLSGRRTAPWQAASG